MLLAIDVGNTNTVFGLYEGKDLLRTWRVATRSEQTKDEYAVLLRGFFSMAGYELSEVHAIIIASVVPPTVHALTRMSESYFNRRPMVVGPGIKTGISIFYDNPKEVGADRIVNAVAAFEKYQQAVVVVDFGTATTFDCISSRGEYLGGVIAPGIMISVEALFSRASKLPRIEVVRPKNVIGKNTVNSMQSGILFGYVGLVDGIVERIRAEYETPPKVIATGGFSTLIASESSTISLVDENLTLDGLRILHDRNCEEKC
ncbi:MAG: type III pantothenate kinase [Deltaproteobacteria bacterium]|nr:type III pantothenate kinase [Deltaproteobacteria bacterium]